MHLLYVCVCVCVCSVRPEVEKKGLLGTKESCWAYYVQKCRNNLHVVLAMSPVGETLRMRCRNFPGMVRTHTHTHTHTHTQVHPLHSPPNNHMQTCSWRQKRSTCNGANPCVCACVCVCVSR